MIFEFVEKLKSFWSSVLQSLRGWCFLRINLNYSEINLPNGWNHSNEGSANSEWHFSKIILNHSEIVLWICWEDVINLTEASTKSESLTSQKLFLFSQRFFFEQVLEVRIIFKKGSTKSERVALFENYSKSLRACS